MNYTNELKIKFNSKEELEKAKPVLINIFSTTEFYTDYVEGLAEKVISDLRFEEELIVLGNGLDGYFTPEDSRKVFETLFTQLAETLTTIDFLAEAGNIGNYSSSKITAQFEKGSFNLQNEYWSDCLEDGESELKETSKYFF